MRRTLFPAAVLFGVLAIWATAAYAAESKDSSQALDPRGSPDERLINQAQRYYVWHDREGWHLRSAAKSMIKFEGSVRVIGGAFRRLRPTGLESTGRFPDRWAIDAKRQELQFLINTSTSFDGFDFTVDGDATEIEFELMSAGGEHPKRIFIGEKAAHPAEANFRLPADPVEARRKAAGSKEG